MKKIDFTKNGGFPLEQETLKRLQTAYKDELYSMLKQHIGIDNDENYVISHATENTEGWLMINGNLYSLAKDSTRTDFVKTVVTETALRFGDGSYRTVYTDYEAEYISELPTGDAALTSPNPETTRPNIIVHMYYSLNEFNTIGFLPLDGSKPMEGDLDLGGNQLSNLDTLDTEIANLRSKYFNFGFSGERGTPGRALVDEKKGGKNTLHINYGTDWENTAISGGIEFTDFAENNGSTQASPLIIDVNGVVGKGNPYQSIPVGLIALWHNINGAPPEGWVICDGGVSNVATFTIPNLTNNTVLDGSTPASPVNYIIYVGLDVPTIDIEHSVLQTLSPGETSYNATATPLTVIAVASNLSSFTWEIIAPVTTPVSTPVITQGTDPLQASITGELYPGIYSVKIKGIHTDGNGVETEYFAESVINIQANNLLPVFESARKTTITTINEVDSTETNDIVGNVINISSGIAPLDTSLSGRLRPTSDQKVFVTMGVSDPDGNIFSNDASLLCKISHLDGTESLITDITPIFFIDPNASIKYFTYEILVADLLPTDTIHFVATDEVGGVTTKIYTLNIIEEPIITSGGRRTIVLSTSDRIVNSYPIKVIGTANSVVNLTGEQFYKAGTSIPLGKVTIKGYDDIGSSLMLDHFLLHVDEVDNTSQFEVTLDENGEKVFQAEHEIIKPDSTALNQDITYNISSRISLRSNLANNLETSMSYSVSTGGTTTTTTTSGTCFDVESYVSLASGRSKKLKNIQVGDKLIGLDFKNRIDESEGDYLQWSGKLNEATKTEVTVVSKKTYTAPSYFEISTDDSKIIKVTGEHPLLVTQDNKTVKWVRTKDITEAMYLVDKNHATKKIAAIKFINENLKVALLDVESIDNYIISGIAAHNRKDPNQDNLISDVDGLNEIP